MFHVTAPKGARARAPKGRQDLAGGFSRRIRYDPDPSPEGTAEPRYNALDALSSLPSLRDWAYCAHAFRRLKPPAKPCQPFGLGTVGAPVAGVYFSAADDFGEEGCVCLLSQI